MTQINQNFCDTLHREAAADWQAATRHRFVDEIFAGTLSDAHLRRYLVQDYRFIDRFTALLLGNPEVAAWLRQNLKGNNVADIKAIRLQFGLGLREAKALLDQYRAQ